MYDGGHGGSTEGSFKVLPKVIPTLIWILKDKQWLTRGRHLSTLPHDACHHCRHLTLILLLQPSDPKRNISHFFLSPILGSSYTLYITMADGD